MSFLKNIEDIAAEVADPTDVLTNPDYIRKSYEVVTDALRNGGDVMQLSDGTIVVTKVETYHLHYAWDDKKGKMVRLKSNRAKKSKEDAVPGSIKEAEYEIAQAVEEEFEEAY